MRPCQMGAARLPQKTVTSAPVTVIVVFFFELFNT